VRAEEKKEVVEEKAVEESEADLELKARLEAL
jgi:hypothetical protein